MQHFVWTAFNVRWTSKDEKEKRLGKKIRNDMTRIPHHTHILTETGATLLQYVNGDTTCSCGQK